MRKRLQMWWRKVERCWLDGTHSFPLTGSVLECIHSKCGLCGAEYMDVYGR